MFFISFSLCLSEMAGVGLFLADMTSHVLDLQVRLEDALRASSQVVTDGATAAHQVDALRHLRLGVSAVQEVYSCRRDNFPGGG